MDLMLYWPSVKIFHQQLEQLDSVHEVEVEY